jgi:hypothetical protein
VGALPPRKGKTALRDDKQRRAAQRMALAAFLRARRARLRPADVGPVVGSADG